MPRIFQHHLFRHLRYRYPAWHGEIPYAEGKLSISLIGKKTEPDAKLLKVAAEVFSRLGHFEQLALSFISSSSTFEPTTLRLVALEVLYPAKEWINQTLSGQNRTALTFVSSKSPIFALTFTIAGDLNVLDVIFASEKPIVLDYH